MKRILVVDDNPVSLELMREALEEPAVEILEAHNGEQALDLLRVVEPDLVLLDLQMPVLDGYAVLQRIRQDPRLAHIRVVAFTASAMRGDREKALAAGFDDYLTKPVQLGPLRNRIRRLLAE